MISTKEAISIARSKDLDLVVVAPNAKPVVAKIMDYSKHRYEMQKKQKEMKKNQKIVQLKQIRISPTIDKNDLNTKIKQASKFLSEGDKVKITLRVHGRMITHTDITLKVINNFIESLSDISKIEQEVKQEGRSYSAVIVPKNENK